MRKVFNKELYDQCDGVAKKAVSSLMESHGYTIIPKEEDYSSDIKAFKPIYVEVERKLGWDSDVFPFDTVVLSTRRRESFKKASRMVVTNKAVTKALVAKTKDILESPTKPLPNKYVKEGEIVFDVPIEKWKLFDL